MCVEICVMCVEICVMCVEAITDIDILCIHSNEL